MALERDLVFVAFQDPLQEKISELDWKVTAFREQAPLEPENYKTIDLLGLYTAHPARQVWICSYLAGLSLHEDRDAIDDITITSPEQVNDAVLPRIPIWWIFGVPAVLPAGAAPAHAVESLDVCNWR